MSSQHLSVVKKWGPNGWKNDQNSHLATSGSSKSSLHHHQTSKLVWFHLQWFLLVGKSKIIPSHQNWANWTLTRQTRWPSSNHQRSNFHASWRMPNEPSCVFLWVSASFSWFGKHSPTIWGPFSVSGLTVMEWEVLRALEMAVALEVSFFLTILAIARLFRSVSFAGRPLLGRSLNELVCLTVALIFWMPLTERPVARAISAFERPCCFKVTTWTLFSWRVFSTIPAKVRCTPLVRHIRSLGPCTWSRDPRIGRYVTDNKDRLWWKFGQKIFKWRRVGQKIPFSHGGWTNFCLPLYSTKVW